jgi:hypothetical protein
MKAVSYIARDRSESMGKVFSDLARRGLKSRTGIKQKGNTGFPIFSVPEDTHPITLDDVKKLEDEV